LKKHIIVGDIHSNHICLTKILNKYDPEEYNYIFLGDYCDYRNENPRENSNYMQVILSVMAVVEHWGGIALLGNHDDKLKRWFAGNKVDIKEGLSETIYDIQNTVSPELVPSIKEFLNGLPICHQQDINGMHWKFAHAYNPYEQEIFARSTESTPREWRKMHEFCIYGVPRTPEGERTLWWEHDKYLDLIQEGHVKIAGHYHTVVVGPKYMVLDATPGIASYVIEDDLLEIWKRD
jgi:predicted phosphodiesterase